MKVFTSTFAFLALAAAIGQAEPLNLTTVAADAKWVVHVDVDAVRASHVVQKAFETCPILKSESPKHFDKLRDQIGMDLRKDLHGVTFYGSDTDKTHGVMIVFGEVDKKLLLEKAKKATDHKTTKHGGTTIHSWTQKCGGKTHPAAGAFYKDSAVVFAADADAVGKALDILNGKSDGITDPKSPLGGRVAPGTILLAKASAIDAKTRCPVLKQAESFRIALGENDGKSFYRARLVMKSAEAAEQIKTINDGFKAMASLRFSGEADVMKLIDGVKTTVTDSTIRIRWDASADDVWTVAERLGKKAEERMKKAGAHPPAPGATKTSACPVGCQCPICKAKEKTNCDCTKCKDCAKCKAGEPCDCPDCKNCKGK